MRKPIKAICAVGATALIMSGAAMGQKVPTLGELTFGELAGAANDTACATAINTATSQTTAACNTLAEGVGFIQRQIDVNGLTYIQTSITDGTFNSEDFVQIQFTGNTGGGIKGVASKLTLSEGSTALDGDNVLQVDGTGFVADSLIYSGWAHSDPAAADGDSEAVIRVDVGDDTKIGNAFRADFSVDTAFDFATGVNIINSMEAVQTVELGATTDVQRFVTQVKAAATATTAPFDLGVGAIGQVEYAQDDMIQVVWVGQAIAGLGSFGTVNLSNIELTPATANVKTSLSNLANVGPFGWTGTIIEDEFGAAPVF